MSRTARTSLLSSRLFSCLSLALVLFATFSTVGYGADPQRVYVGTIQSDAVFPPTGFPAKLLIYDAATRAVLVGAGTFDPNPNDSFQGVHKLAVAPDGTTLYLPINSFAGYKVRFVQPSGNTSSPDCTVGTFPVGIAVTPSGAEVYVATRDSNAVDVVSTAAHNLLATISVGQKPMDVAMAPDGSNVYVTLNSGDAVQVISTSTRQVTATIPVGDAPFGIAINPSGTRLFVAEQGTNQLTVIDTATRSVLGSVAVGNSPHWVAVAPDGKTAWVTNSVGNSVTVVDTATRSVIRTVTVGTGPEGIAFMPNGQEVWVVNSSPSGGSSISIIQTTDYTVSNVVLPTGFSGPLVGYSIAVTDTTGKIAGRISSAGGAPVGGATVRARQSGQLRGEAVSSPSGDYSIFNLQPGNYDVEISAPGFPAVAPSSQSVAAGQTRVVNFELTSNTCVGTASPATSHYFPNGGTGQIQVTAPGSCSWAATTASDWITITSGGTGSGNGTIGYSVAVHSGTAERTGAILIGGQTVTITQEACPGISISPATLVSAVLGGPYSSAFAPGAGVAPFSYALTGGQLPPGLALSSGGVISGTPTKLGDYNFQVTVTASYGCTGTADFKIRVVGTDSATWLSLTSNTTDQLNAVHFVNESLGWVAGRPGSLMKTIDGGLSWTTKNFSAFGSEKFNSVRFLDANVGWAGTVNGVVRTLDGGESWFSIRDSNANVRRSSWYPISQDMVWATGNVNLQSGYYHWRFAITGPNSVDSNTWWANVNYGMLGITFADANNGWSVGQGGRLIRISSAAVPPSSEWNPLSVQTSGTTQTLRAVDAFDTQKAWAVGDNGTILRTTNGTSWTSLTPGITTTLNAVHFADANTGWVVGNGGLILGTSDGGETWVQESSQSSSDLLGVTFAGTGYAVGRQGTIVKRTGCSYSVSTNAVAFGNGGGAGSVGVTGTGGCNWVAISQSPWISISSAASASTSGSVAYLVAPNNGPARTGTLSIAGRTVTINQAAGVGLLVFPEYANGAAFDVLNRTRIVLQNNGTQPDTGRIDFLDSAGNPVSVPVQGQMVSSLPYSLSAGGATDLQTDGTGSLVIGALKVTSDGGAESRAQGTEVFDLFGRYVSVPAAPIRNAHQVYVSVTASENTGMALFNHTGTALTLNMRLIDSQGAQQATGQLVLAPGQQLARFVNEAELFKSYFDSHPGDFKGTLNVQAADGREVGVTGLVQKTQTGALIAVGTGPRVFASGESTIMQPGSSPAVVLIFPHYVTGEAGGVPNRTRIVLKNSANQEDTGHIRFQDTNGAPVVVSIGGQSGSNIPYSIPAWGTLDVETSGTGPIQSGSVLVVSNRGLSSGLEGTEVFDVLGNYVSVDSATSGSSHKLYASRDATENTGIAVYNPGSEAVTVNLALTDGQGIEQATALLTVQAGQQVARFLHEAEMFKVYFDAHPGAFKGSLTARVQGEKALALTGLIQKTQTGALIAIAASKADQ